MARFNKSFITSKYLGGPTKEEVAPGAEPGIEKQPKEKKGRTSVPKLGLKFTANRRGDHTVVFNDTNNKRSFIKNDRGDFFMLNDNKIKHAVDSGSLAGARRMSESEANYLMSNIVGGKKYEPGETPLPKSPHTQKLSAMEPEIEPETPDLPAPSPTTPEFKKGGSMTYKKGKKLAKPVAVKYKYGMVLPKGKNKLKARKKCGGKAAHVVMKKGGDTGGCGCGDI